MMIVLFTFRVDHRIALNKDEEPGHCRKQSVAGENQHQIQHDKHRDAGRNGLIQLRTHIQPFTDGHEPNHNDGNEKRGRTIFKRGR